MWSTIPLNCLEMLNDKDVTNWRMTLTSISHVFDSTFQFTTKKLSSITAERPRHSRHALIYLSNQVKSCELLVERSYRLNSKKIGQGQHVKNSTVEMRENNCDNCQSWLQRTPISLVPKCKLTWCISIQKHFQFKCIHVTFKAYGYKHFLFSQ